MRLAISSGCSTKFDFDSITPGISTLSGGSFTISTEPIHGHGADLLPSFAKTRTDGALIHCTNEWATGLLPHLASRAAAGRRSSDGLFQPQGFRQSGKVSKMVNSCVALLRTRRTCW